MAKKNKTIEVQKFGGVEELGTTTLNDHKHELSSVETQSETNLENDTGTGRAVVMRTYTFKLNKDIFKNYVPSKQELFDSHVKGIEMHLWRDGLVLAKEYEPHILFNKKDTYSIFIVATPSTKDVLLESTQTLSEIIHS